MTIVPIILCGGAGTRLWPASRSAWPKQFLPLVGSRSLYQETLLRVATSDFGRPVVVTNTDHRFIAAEQALAVGVPVDILLEPKPRDSGPALLAGAQHVARRDTADTPVLALAADHAIRDADAFRTCAMAATRAAMEGRIVTFGIEPTRPASEYGYIQPAKNDGNQDAEDGAGVVPVARFVEKPDEATAKRYVEQGFLWNSGNFLARADTLVEEYRRHHPKAAQTVLRSVTDAEADLDFLRLDPDAFAAADALSIDYAVMERTDRASVTRASFDWSDVGSWEALGTLFEQDGQGNAIHGEALAVSASGNVVQTSGPLVVLNGVDDLVVSVTDDAVLVTRKDAGHSMKAAVERVRAHDPVLTREHVTNYRPWGSYKSIDVGGRHQVKRIVVKPGAILSLQHHHHRAEHWVVVRGAARVTLGEEVRTLHENEGVYIPTGTVHRLENPGKIPLELIEVQTGSYLGEDDIVRHEDLYARRTED